MANIKNSAPLVTKGVAVVGGNNIYAPTQPTTNPTAPSAVSTILTKFQFRKLFTMAERIAVDNAQYSSKLSSTQKATVATVVKDLDSSAEVHLGTPDVTNGVGYLASVGLITPQRAQRILANLPPL